MRLSRGSLRGQKRLIGETKRGTSRGRPVEDVVQLVMEKSGYEEPNPLQSLALKKGLLDDKSMVICSATASGKTAVAEMAFMKNLMESGRSVVYIVPLRALATEKYEEFQEKYGPLGYRVRIQSGDRDLSKSPFTLRFDILVTTSERCDSILRSRPMWFDDVGVVVVDEIHLLDSEKRGPTLEIVITKFRKMNPRTRILALSATIGNPEELADWLEADLVISDWRPVKLLQGIYRNRKIKFIEEDGEKQVEVVGAGGPPAVMLAHDVVLKNKQALLFTGSRKGAERLAEDVATSIGALLSEEDKIKLSDLADRILGDVDYPTVQCRRLAKVVRHGSAFHHAGETSKQKKLVEDSFRAGLLRVISATPTLIYGVNLPAMRVVVRDLKRFSGFVSEYIPVLEYRQMCGRAGRPQYDDIGQAITIAKTKAEEEAIKERYLTGDIEDIGSKLALEPILRMHVLGLIASGFVRRWEELMNVLASTFYGHQFGANPELEAKIEGVVGDLIEYGFIQHKEGMYQPTPIGKRVSELYIDPDTGYRLYLAMSQMKKRKKRVSSLTMLLMICYTVEMRPLLRLGGDWGELEEKLEDIEGENIVEAPGEWGYEYEEYLRAMRTSLMFESWINEAGEDAIHGKFGVPPGGLRAKVETADWLLYASSEIARILRSGGRKELDKMRVRIKYGVREDALTLVSIPQIGRVRARALMKAGYREIDDLKRASVVELAMVPKIGQGIAPRIKSWIEQNYPSS
ncbi:MAG: DEAD/DEAH box helicase [Theionarchaea archaeon]|nr:DEAD/DEAH box helicase [Theionarchaea archaeon]